MMIRLPALAAALALAGAAQAESIDTAADLQRLCSAEPTTVEGETRLVACYAYLTGVMQYHRQIGMALPQRRATVCPPDGVTRAEVAQTFLAFMAANPAEAGSPTLAALGKAARAKWPCPR